MSSDVGVRRGGGPLRRLGHALILDVAARLVFAVGLVGSMTNLLVGDAVPLPPRGLLIAALSGGALMLVTESLVFNRREQLGLRVRGRRLWSVTSGKEREALRGVGLQRLEWTHRAGTIASLVAVGVGVLLGLVGLLSL